MLTRTSLQYSDIDTRVLSPPSAWIQKKDVAPWTDPQTDQTYGPVKNSLQPVGLILGIEADTPEDSDSYWRMGYTYPVQLTQWTLASGVNNSILHEFISDWCLQMQSVGRDNHNAGSELYSHKDLLLQIDPLELTGPVAITKTTKNYLDKRFGLRWQALSGLEDGGRSKLIGETLILPITGFRYVTDHALFTAESDNTTLVQEEVRTATWAPSLFLIQMHVSSTMHRDHGGN